jgi:hypothetical protein
LSVLTIGQEWFKSLTALRLGERRNYTAGHTKPVTRFLHNCSISTLTLISPTDFNIKPKPTKFGLRFHNRLGILLLHIIVPEIWHLHQSSPFVENPKSSLALLNVDQFGPWVSFSLLTQLVDADCYCSKSKWNTVHQICHREPPNY